MSGSTTPADWTRHRQWHRDWRGPIARAELSLAEEVHALRGATATDESEQDPA